MYLLFEQHSKYIYTQMIVEDHKIISPKLLNTMQTDDCLKLE